MIPYIHTPLLSAQNFPALAFYILNIAFPFLLILIAAFILGKELQKYRRRHERQPSARRVPPWAMIMLACVLLLFPVCILLFIAIRAVITPAIPPQAISHPPEWRGTTMVVFGTSIATYPTTRSELHPGALITNALPRPHLETLMRQLAWLSSTTAPDPTRLSRRELVEICNRPAHAHTFSGALLTELTTLFHAPRAHLARLGSGHAASMVMMTPSPRAKMPFEVPVGIHSAGIVTITIDENPTSETEARFRSILDWTLSLDYAPIVSISVMNLTPQTLQTISKFKNLERLLIGYESTDPTSFTCLSGSTELQSLNLSFEPTWPGTIASLPAFPRLRKLNLYNVGVTTDDQLPAVMFTTNELIMFGCSNLTGRFLDRLAANPNLEQLQLYNVPIGAASPTLSSPSAIPIQYAFIPKPIPLEYLRSLAQQGNVTSLNCASTPLTLEIAALLCQFPKLTQIQFRDPAPEAISLLAQKSTVRTAEFFTADPKALQSHVDAAKTTNKLLTITLLPLPPYLAVTPAP